MATPLNWFGNAVGAAGRYVGLPEMGVSEMLGGSGIDGRVQSGNSMGPNNTYASPESIQKNKQQIATNRAVATSPEFGSTGSVQGASTASADDIAFLRDRESQLRSLLGRTDTGLSQGLTRNEDEYSRNVGQANADKERAYGGFADQRVDQNRDKLGAYEQINRGAANGFRSLAQIIGRAAGTGSSAFRELLPDVVGKDTSSKRMDATENFGRNLQAIDKSQNQFDIDFEDVLADLLRQKRGNEENLRAGIEGQRQSINDLLAQNAGDLSQAQGGGYDAVKAAQAPFQTAIDNSRNQVESFFNQFRNSYNPRQAVATAPELSGYTVDRSNVNASSGQPGENPYSSLLRKRLQGLA